MLDSSIPLSVKSLDAQPLIKNYQDAQMQQASLRDMAQQRDLRAEQLKSVQLRSTEEARQAHEDQTLRGLAQINDIRTPEGQEQYIQDVSKLGLGHKVPEIASQFAAQRAAQVKAAKDAEAAQRQEALDRLDLRSRILPGAKDQASYETAKRRLKSLGDDLSGLEPQFNPSVVASHVGEVLTHKERLEQEQRAADTALKTQSAALDTNKFGLSTKEFGEKVRHDKAQEAIDATKAAEEAKKSSIGNSRLVSSYLSDWRHNQDNYDKAAGPYLALKGIKNSKSYGTGVGDQSMMDKLIMLETGHVPTEAQYTQMATNYGVVDLFDKVTGKMKEGAKLPQKVRDQIESEAEEQMKIVHDRHLALRGEKERQMLAAGVNPDAVLQSGEYFDKIGKMLSPETQVGIQKVGETVDHGDGVTVTRTK